MNLYALITGASSGIGKEFARVLAREGYHLILVARRTALLESIKKEIIDQYKVDVQTITMDLSIDGAGQHVYEKLDAYNSSLNIVVNNAGFADYGEFISVDWEKQKRMIHLNVMTVVELCRIYGKLFVDRGSGNIINVASTAAFMPGPLMSIYFATKAFVVSFSEALANELKSKKVGVTVLCPSATDTEFQQTAGMERSWIARVIPRESAKAVAEFGYRAMKQGKIVAIHGWLNWIMAFCLRFIPRNMVTELTRKTLE